MSKKEFHYINSNSGSEYSWKFEIQSKIGRFFFNFKPPLKNGYCNLGCGYRFLENYVNADFFQFNKTFMQSVSNQIVNNIRGINRVVYDITSKPPSTIELE